MVVISSNPDDEGTYEVTVKVSFEKYPEVVPIMKTINVYIQCKILEWKIGKGKALPVKVTQTILVDPPIVTPFQLVAVPACKSVLIELTPPMPFQTFLNLATSEITINSTTKEHAATYELKLTGKPKPPNIGAVSEQTMKVELFNLCHKAKFDAQKIDNLEVFIQSQEYF